MNQICSRNSACRYCQYYKPLGRRGGECKMLNVSVRGEWKSCPLGIPVFKGVS